MAGDARRILVGAAAALAASLAHAAPAQIAVQPMKWSGAVAQYPRLVRFPDAKVAAKVNAALATQERSDRQTRAECLQDRRDAAEPPSPDAFHEDIAVSWLTARFLTVNVVGSYDCAAAYPTAGAESPLTLDLATGAQVDWKAMFRPAFAPVLTRLYRARWRAGPDADPDGCKEAINDQDPFEEGATFWLEKGRGLVVQPDLPHVVAACASPVTLTARDIASFATDKAVVAELAAHPPGAP